MTILLYLQILPEVPPDWTRAILIFCLLLTIASFIYKFIADRRGDGHDR